MKNIKIKGIVGLYKTNDNQVLIINGCIFNVNTKEDFIKFKNTYPDYYNIYKNQLLNGNIIYMLNKDVTLDYFAHCIEQKALEEGYIDNLDIIYNPLQAGYFSDENSALVKKLK